MIVHKIEPKIRETANLGDWLIISPNTASGRVVYEPNLHDVMEKTYEEETILLVDKVTGEEEVPENVKGIVLMNSDDYPDVLAHVSVRARNEKVLLAGLFNQEKCDELRKQEGK